MLCSALALHSAGSILSKEIFMVWPRAEIKESSGGYKEPPLENLNMNLLKLLWLVWAAIYLTVIYTHLLK